MLKLIKTLLYAYTCTLAVLAIPTSVDSSKNLVERQFDPHPDLLGPFSLVTSSKTPKYNGLTIIGRHIGAGINLAVPGGKSAPIPLPDSRYNTYYINNTYGFPANPDDPGSSRSGTLVYPIYSQYPTAVTGSIQANSSSNIAQLWLSVTTPSYEFSFDSKGRLTLKGIWDRWFVCPKLQTNYGPLEGIAWKFGKGPIDDKECVSITIHKYVFPKA